MPEHLGGESPESLGRRIAERRAKLGWTQQELAERLAVSRVAVSHLESGMTTPGERTVALLAGVFGMEPHELVVGTAYPTAKAERLPLVVARHTEVELELALLDNDLRWLEDVPQSAGPVLDRWQSRLSLLLESTHDRRQRALIEDGRDRVRRHLDELH